MFIVLETRNVTLSVNEDSIPGAEKFIIHKISIYTLYFWSGPIPRLKLKRPCSANIGAHFCKVLTLFRIPMSFSSTYRWINPEPNTVIRCKNSMQYGFFNCLNRKSKSSQNCFQCTKATTIWLELIDSSEFVWSPILSHYNYHYPA